MERNMVYTPGFVCITSDMKKFFEVMRELKEGGLVVELNENYRTIGGHLLKPLVEVRESITKELGFEEIKIKSRGNSRIYSIEFYSKDDKVGKSIYLEDIEILEQD